MKKYRKTQNITQFVMSSNLSTRKSSNVCQQLYQEAINVETSQSDNYRFTIKVAVKL